MFTVGKFLRYRGGELNNGTVPVPGKGEVNLVGKVCQVVEVTGHIVHLRFLEIDKPITAFGIEADFEEVDLWHIPVSWKIARTLRIPKEWVTLDQAIVLMESQVCPKNQEGYVADSYKVELDLIPSYNPQTENDPS